MQEKDPWWKVLLLGLAVVVGGYGALLILSLCMRYLGPFTGLLTFIGVGATLAVAGWVAGRDTLENRVARLRRARSSGLPVFRTCRFCGWERLATDVPVCRACGRRVGVDQRLTEHQLETAGLVVQLEYRLKERRARRRLLLRRLTGPRRRGSRGD